MHWPAAILCIVLRFDHNDWLMVLIILGSVDIAHSDSKKSDSRVFFSFRKQNLICFGNFHK